jgi:putative restriction endonuclease
VKAVFDVKPGSGYDDDITRRYHFPARSNYLDAARNAIGDWVLFREPQRNGGRRAYIATARVTNVEPDPDNAGHFYAYVADYLEFPCPVPFAVDGRYAETPLREINDPNRVGQALQGRSMRPILIEDFDAIILTGLSETLAPENSVRLDLDFPAPDLPSLGVPGFAEESKNPRRELPPRGLPRLRQPLRGHRPPDRQWRRSRRGAGRSHQARRSRWARCHPEWHRTLRHRALAV